MVFDIDDRMSGPGATSRRCRVGGRVSSSGVHTVRLGAGYHGIRIRVGYRDHWSACDRLERSELCVRCVLLAGVVLDQPASVGSGAGFPASVGMDAYAYWYTVFIVGVLWACCRRVFRTSGN